jgi:hypothetical protein
MILLFTSEAKPDNGFSNGWCKVLESPPELDFQSTLLENEKVICLSIKLRGGFFTGGGRGPQFDIIEELKDEI